MDSPRFARPLVERIENHGGARLMFLTHIDDVADHKAWARTCGAERIMHSRDLGRSLAGIEKVISGDEPVAIGEGLLAIPTPGHTRGHMVLLYQNRYLFSGDHFRWSDDQHSLRASLDVCWFSWEEQIRSMERLLQYSFEWVLPGHGRRAHFTAAEMHRHLSDCIRSMKPERITP